LHRRLQREGGVTITKYTNANKKKLAGRKVHCWLFDDYILLAAKKSKKVTVPHPSFDCSFLPKLFLILQEEETEYSFVDAIPIVQVSHPKFSESKKRQFEFRVDVRPLPPLPFPIVYLILLSWCSS
jgi:hypothetical protein